MMLFARLPLFDENGMAVPGYLEVEVTVGIGGYSVILPTSKFIQPEKRD